MYPVAARKENSDLSRRLHHRDALFANPNGRELLFTGRHSKSMSVSITNSSKSSARGRRRGLSG